MDQSALDRKFESLISLKLCLIFIDTRRVETELTGKERVLVRYSGTQPQCRVMVESLNTEDTRFFCDKIAMVIKEVIGS